MLGLQLIWIVFRMVLPKGFTTTGTFLMKIKSWNFGIKTSEWLKKNSFKYV
jgi:hypothetical protein